MLLTALAEGTGEIATVPSEATVNTDVDAGVSGNLYAAGVKRCVSVPVDEGVSAPVVERGADGLLVERSIDGFLGERSDHEGHEAFREGSWRRHDDRRELNTV